MASEGIAPPHCHFRTVRAMLTAHGSSAIWSLLTPRSFLHSYVVGALRKWSIAPTR